MHPRLNSALSVTLSLALALSPLPGLAQTLPVWTLPQGPAPTSLPPRSDPDLTRRPDYLALESRAYDRMDAFAAAEPPLPERVLALNLDPQAAFALLRDGVQSQPYAGRLRAPEDVLLAGAANPHDKAAALADILGRMGYDTRLVVGTAPAPVPANPCTPTDPTEAWALTELGPSVALRVQARAAASYALLAPVLALADQPPPDTGPHVWLQIRDGADWVDLDPWAPGTAWGAAPMGPGTPLTDLPQAQAVTVSITVEYLAEDGTLARDEVMSERLEFPEANGSLVALTFAPQIKGVGGTQARVLAEIAGGTAGLVASLRVNDRIAESAPFAAPGAKGEQAGFLAQAGARQTTGVWMTLTSSGPGRADHSETRPILDLVPPALRGQPGLDPAALLPATPGLYLPRGLEGLRQIILSNGGTSRQLVAARTGLEMRGALEVLLREEAGNSDPLDLIWSSFLEAGRISLAAETLIRARPAEAGACLRIGAPRALVWGAGPGADGKGLRWLDWMLDDVAVQGGDAQAQGRLRLWHGTVQAALEKEALMYVLQAAPDLIALDRAPLTDRAAGAEGEADRARGYLTLAGEGLEEGQWWRVNPVTGAADARVALLGNAGFIRPGSNAVNAANAGARARDGISTAEQLRLDSLLRNSRNGDQFYRALEAEDRAAKAARALREREAAAKEEIMLLKFGMGVALVLGAALGTAIILAHRGG